MSIKERIDPKEINERYILEFKFTTCQKEAIKLIYEMRILSTSQIASILKLSKKYISSQLIGLYNGGFLYRKYVSRSFEESKGEAFWMIDRGGALFIAGAYGVSLKKLNWDIRDNLIGFEKLEHSRKISEVRTILEEIANKNNSSIDEAYCDRHLHYEFEIEGKKMGLSPDLYLTYNDGKRIYQYFFEIDMGTMTINGPKTRSSVLISKIPRYEGFLQSKLWKENFEVYPRIIFLTNTKNRALNMVNSIRDSRQSDLDFLVSTFEAFELDPLGKIYKKTSNGEVTNIFE